jgi:indolepyruvate ferredoxin oxidoreductase, beta subunit
VISAALFGALAGSGALPIERATCEDAIRTGGRGVDASLAAFAEAFDRARNPVDAAAASVSAEAPGNEASQRPAALVTGDGSPVPAAIVRAIAALPDEVAAIARIGAAELIDYQDPRYAESYLDRVARIVIAERRNDRNAHVVAHETARRLARWMRYDDVIRVASRKARRSRLARIRAEAGTRDGAVLHVYDLFSPSALEVAAILPRRLGARLERRALLRHAQAQYGTNVTPPGHGVRWHTSSVTGALALRAIAALRPLRPRSLRYAREQQAIEDWLVAIEFALAHDRGAGSDAALEIARLPRLIRGYGDTYETGWSNYRRILDAYRRTAPTDPVRAAAQLRASARAALNDPHCGAGDAAPVAAGRPAAASSRA